MHVRTPWWCIALLASTLASPAAVFHLVLRPGSRVEAGRVTIHAELTNRGDENMNNVQASVRFEGTTNSGPLLVVLPPGDSTQVDLDAGPLPSIRGKYTAVVTARYIDVYGHPFMTTESIPVYTAELPEAFALSATLSQIVLDSKQALTLSVKSHATNNLKARCRLVLPDELLGETAEQYLVIPGNGAGTLTFEVANAWATADSRYRVFAVVDTVVNARHESIVATGAVTVPPRRTLSPATIKSLWLIPGGMLLAFLLAQILPKRKRA